MSHKLLSSPTHKVPSFRHLCFKTVAEAITSQSTESVVNILRTILGPEIPSYDGVYHFAVLWHEVMKHPNRLHIYRATKTSWPRFDYADLSKVLRPETLTNDFFAYLERKDRGRDLSLCLVDFKDVTLPEFVDFSCFERVSFSFSKNVPPRIIEQALKTGEGELSLLDVDLKGVTIADDLVIRLKVLVLALASNVPPRLIELARSGGSTIL